MVSGPNKESVAFTAADALEVARHLQEFPSVVLVGGQALNFWAEQFRAGVPELDRLAPFESRDVDFLATVRDVEVCARRLGGIAKYPSMDQVNTPEVGVIHCVINGKELKIDFLGYLAGLRSGRVRKAAIEATIDGIVLRVMHPINVVSSRIANVIQLRRSDALALRQARTSIHIAAEFIRRAALEDPRIALDLIEAVFETALSRDGIKAWHAFEIDASSALRPFEGLPAAFAERRLPQMIGLLSEKRKRFRDGQVRHAERKRK